MPQSEKELFTDADDELLVHFSYYLPDLGPEGG
jgi:hypothetical protein